MLTMVSYIHRRLDKAVGQSSGPSEFPLVLELLRVLLPPTEERRILTQWCVSDLKPRDRKIIRAFPFYIDTY